MGERAARKLHISTGDYTFSLHFYDHKFYSVYYFQAEPFIMFSTDLRDACRTDEISNLRNSKAARFACQV